MKILIAEDDPTSRRFLFGFLSKYGLCDITQGPSELKYDAFVSKPIDICKLEEIMQNMGLIETKMKGEQS